MQISLDQFSVMYGDGHTQFRSLGLPRETVLQFLEQFFRKLYAVDENRNCHRCIGSCQFGMTLHVGRPFHRRFNDCIPRLVSNLIGNLFPIFYFLTNFLVI